MLKRLLFPDPTDSGGGNPIPSPSAPPSNPIPEPQKPPIEAKPIGGNPAPPATAKAVIEGTKTERELELERKLKERETENARLEDDNRTLKQRSEPAKPPGGPEKKKSWLSGATFFDEDE